LPAASNAAIGEKINEIVVETGVSPNTVTVTRELVNIIYDYVTA